METKSLEHICKTCQNPDGSPNTDYLNENGTCTFGCNRRIDEYGICPECKDHSNNTVECEECGRMWEQPNPVDGTWYLEVY